jgi:hypothetical protein
MKPMKKLADYDHPLVVDTAARLIGMLSTTEKR